jgi:hypothetical protein
MAISERLHGGKMQKNFDATTTEEERGDAIPNDLAQNLSGVKNHLFLPVTYLSSSSFLIVFFESSR